MNGNKQDKGGIVASMSDLQALRRVIGEVEYHLRGLDAGEARSVTVINQIGGRSDVEKALEALKRLLA